MTGDWLYPSQPITLFSSPTSGQALRRSFRAHFRLYRSKHRTSGCRVSHMIGVPIIILSLFLLPFKPRAAVKMQVAGWLLQAIGHFVFEHNKPVLLEVHDTMTVWSALVFNFRLWRRFIRQGKIKGPVAP